MELVGRTETSVRNYYYSLLDSPAKRLSNPYQFLVPGVSDNVSELFKESSFELGGFKA